MRPTMSDLERITRTLRIISVGMRVQLTPEDADALLELLDRLELAETVCRAAGEIPVSMRQGWGTEVCVDCEEAITRAHGPRCDVQRLQTALEAWGAQNA
jgi:hypothetical protein